MSIRKQEEFLERQTIALERIADSLERAYPPIEVKEKPSRKKKAEAEE